MLAGTDELDIVIGTQQRLGLYAFRVSTQRPPQMNFLPSFPQHFGVLYVWSDRATMAPLIALVFLYLASHGHLVSAGSNVVAYLVEHLQELEGLPCRKDGVPDFMCTREENLSAIISDCHNVVAQLLLEHNQRVCELEVGQKSVHCRKSCQDVLLHNQELSERISSLYASLIVCILFIALGSALFLIAWWPDQAALATDRPSSRFYTMQDLNTYLTSPIGLPRNLCTDEEACKKLKEKKQVPEEGPSNNVTSSILTFAPSPRTSGTDFLFLLVPVNTSTAAASKIKLFGRGGAYTPAVDAARHLMIRHLLDARLLIVLYERGGPALSTETLHKLNKSADEIAEMALPRDGSHFPIHDELVVLWRDEDDVLKVYDSGGASVISDFVLAQKWAR